MDASSGAAHERPADVVLAVPEIRDYHAINSEIVRHLDLGCRTIRLSGVRGQRLLAAGLTGPWSAVVEVDGEAGPELAARLDAPGLIVVGRGGAADGAASGMRAGRVLVLGSVGMAFGYALRGGLAVAAGEAAGRAGLGQSGGDLVLLAGAGAMAGERQAGGRIFADSGRVGPHAGRGRRGGRFILLAGDVPDDPDWLALAELLGPLGPWLGPAAWAPSALRPSAEVERSITDSRFKAEQ